MAQAGRTADVDVDVDVDVFSLRVDDLSFFPGGGAVYPLVVQCLSGAGAVFAHGGEAVKRVRLQSAQQRTGSGADCYNPRIISTGNKSYVRHCGYRWEILCKPGAL